MENKEKLIKEELIKKSFTSNKLRLETIYLLMKESKKYENIILNYYKPEKEKKINLFFLFFSKYKQWINPFNINIFPFEEHFKMIKNEFNEKIEKVINNKIDKQKIIKIFIYWYIFALIKIGDFFEDIKNNENLQKNLIAINEFKNILLQTNDKIINIYKIKKINTEESFIFIYIYLLFIEYFTKNLSHEKYLKFINTIIFTLFFDLFQKISINILSDYENIEQSKININIFNSFLDELKTNKFINNDYNIIILLDNNIIQSFIENILIHINPKIMEKICPRFSDKLAEFYSNILKFRFIKSNLMDYLINKTKNSFINLTYFSEEKEKIINDIFMNNFYSNLIQKLFIQETQKLEHPNFNSFLFNGNNSKMSIKLGELSLNDNLILFSFHIKPNINENNIYNIKQPLVCFYNYKKEVIFKLLLKQIDNNNDNNNKNKQKNFLLSIIYKNKKEETVDLNELNIVNYNVTYFICIHLNKSFINIYLYSSSPLNTKVLKSTGEIKMNFKEEAILLKLGYDDLTKQKEYFSGYIGNFYMIKLNNAKIKIDYENIKFIIENILILKEYYRYIIFYLNLNKSEKNSDYNLDYISFYKNKNEIWEAMKIFEIIENKSNNYYEIILCLFPELFKFFNLKDKNSLIQSGIPTLPGICEKQREFIISDINITFVKYDYSKDIFLMKNGLNYFCLQFEYYFQFTNYYLLFKNNNQLKVENVEKNYEMLFYKENIDICTKLINNSINNILLLLVKYIIDSNINNFSITLKQIFSTLFSTIKVLNSICNIIESIFHQLSSIIIIICDQLAEIYRFINLNKNINLLDKNDDIQFFISFRDGLIDILLTNEFYTKSSHQFIELLFERIISILDSNSIKDITDTYPNIFIKVLSFTFLISDSFQYFDPNSNKDSFKIIKGNNSILYTYLKLVKGLIIKKKRIYNDDIYFKQLFIFALRDFRPNQFISYAFLVIINDLLKEGFSLDDSEILELINYFDEIMKNNEYSDENKENHEKNQNFKNELITLIILILLDNIFEKNMKRNFNYFYNEIKKIELNDCQFISIINKLIELFSNNVDFKNMSVIKNINNINPRKKSSTNSINISSENFNYMNFYEDIFDFILLLFKKKLCKKENINNNIQNHQDENIDINKNTNSINMIKSDRVKSDLLNLLVFILEMINSFINNHSIQITTIYCLFNFIKLVHIITFDDNLMDLYKEDKYLLFLKNFFESCKNSKIIYTNYYINPNEKKSTILKTIPESIMDICIKIITSDIIKDNKEYKYKEIILKKNNILDILYDIFLNETKDKKVKNNKNRTLFCYNDIYRFIFSKKITNLKTELNKINSDKIIKKNFNKFDEELFIINGINNLLLDKEKKFNFNFITFNLDKINKYYYNIEKSSSINKELSKFLDTLLERLINEHQILYNINKDFFFKNSSNYSNYNKIKTIILNLLEQKKFDIMPIKEELEEKFSQKLNVCELVTSGLCENIKEKKKIKKKTELKKNSIDSNIKKDNSKINNIDIKSDGSNISPPQTKNLSHSVNNNSENNINNSRSNSLTSEVIIQSEGSVNNDFVNISIENGEINEKISSTSHTSNTNKSTKLFIHVRSNSNYSLKTELNENSSINIINNHIENCNKNDNISFKKYLLEDLNEIKNDCYFNKLDYIYLFNVKRDLMKNIFAINFIDTFFYDKAFIELTKLYNQNYGDIIESQKQKIISLNYPTKIKNFSNGVDTPLFLKPFKFF